MDKMVVCVALGIRPRVQYMLGQCSLSHTSTTRQNCTEDQTFTLDA